MPRYCGYAYNGHWQEIYVSPDDHFEMEKGLRSRPRLSLSRPLPQTPAKRDVRSWSLLPATQNASGSDGTSSIGEWTLEDVLTAPPELAEIASLPLLGLPNYIIDGWTNLISASPRAGKTELMARSILSWSELGKSILYITEEAQQLWILRMQGLDNAGLVPGSLSQVRFVYAPGREAHELASIAFAAAEDVVIVDTIKSVLSFQDERDNSEVVRAVKPWIAHFASTPGKTLIMIHHNRKGGGEHGEAISGAHAFLASFDAVLQIERIGKQPTHRRITAFSRIVQPPDFIYEKVGDELRVVGFVDGPMPNSLPDVKQRALAALTPEWQTQQQISAKMDPKPSDEQVRKALVELASGSSSGEVVAERDPPIEVSASGNRNVKWRLITSNNIEI